MHYFLSFVRACSITKINIALFKSMPETVIIVTFFAKTKGGLGIDAKDKIAEIYHVDLLAKLYCEFTSCLIVYLLTTSTNIMQIQNPVT